MIHLQKTMFYERSNRWGYGTRTVDAIFCLSARLTKTRTLQLRFIKTTGLSTATPFVDDTILPKPFQNFANKRANFELDTHRLELLMKDQKKL